MQKEDLWVFRYKRPSIQRLTADGVECKNGIFRLSRPLLDGVMRLDVGIVKDGGVYTRVTDSEHGDEYVLHRVSGAVGAFVGEVRAQYEAALFEISEKYFVPEVFKSEQAKAVITYAEQRYGDAPEYLWQRFPDNAIIRRGDNKKWYLALLTVSRRKLGFDTDEPVEIIDLRIDPSELESTVDNINYFPGYHMNKKHWITVCLDGSVPTPEILRRIDDSYMLARK